MLMLILYAIHLRHLHFFGFYALTFGHERVMSRVKDRGAKL